MKRKILYFRIKANTLYKKLRYAYRFFVIAYKCYGDNENHLAKAKKHLS